MTSDDFEQLEAAAFITIRPPDFHSHADETLGIGTGDLNAERAVATFLQLESRI